MSGAYNSIWVFHLSGRPKHMSHHLLFPRVCIVKELESIVKSVLEPRHCDAGCRHPKRPLNYCPHLLLLFSVGGNTVISCCKRYFWQYSFKIFYLLIFIWKAEAQRQTTHAEGDFPSVESLFKCLQQLGLGLAKARNPWFNLGVPHGWQGPNYSSHVPLAGS